MTWHADSDLLEKYARGDVDDARAFSVETHLVECERCRAAAAAAVGPSRVADSWAGIDAALDAPRPGPVEWLVLRLGLSPRVARLLSATPALRVSWLSAVALTLAFSVASAYGGHGERAMLLFLLVAPLLPLAGVAAAFSPALDPAGELTMASPSGGFPLLLLRTVAVLVSTTVLAGLAALALPQFDGLAAAWLLPALGLSVASLALATVAPPLPAAGVVATAWVGGVLLTEILGAGGLRAVFVGGPVESGAFHAGGQLTFLAVTLVAGCVVVARRHSFDVGRTA
jgi:hypothetical protein